MTDAGTREACVVTGVAGFVGSHLAERLLAMGYAVVGVDNMFSGRRENMAAFEAHPAFSFYEADVREKGLLEQLSRSHPRMGCCIHLAAIVSVPYSMDHREETMEVNYRAAVRLLEETERTGGKTFVFAGSAAEYGDDQRLPLREDCATEKTCHLSPYGRAKFLASREVAESGRGVALRFFNIYGPRQDPGSPYSGVISRFTEMARSGEPLTIFGDGRQTRDFIYVSDVVDAYLRAAALGEGGAVPPGVYNVGTGKGTTVLEIARVIQGICRRDGELRFLPERPGDIRHSVAAVDRFREAAQWSAKIPLTTGLRKTIEA